MARPEVTGRQIGDKPLVVGPTKACFLLHCSKDKLYALIKSGALESYLEGDRRKITVRSIEAHIEERLAANGDGFRPAENPRKQKVAA
jgi:excisionase family DNA binding protein